MPTKLTQVKLPRYAGSKALLRWLQLPAAHLQYKEIKIAPHIKLYGSVFKMKSYLGRGLRNLWTYRSLSYEVILRRILHDVYFLNLKGFQITRREHTLLSCML